MEIKKDTAKSFMLTLLMYSVFLLIVVFTAREIKAKIDESHETEIPEVSVDNSEVVKFIDNNVMIDNVGADLVTKGDNFGDNLSQDLNIIHPDINSLIKDTSFKGVSGTGLHSIGDITATKYGQKDGNTNMFSPAKQLSSGKAAKSYCFVIDGSGSLIDTIPFVKEEMMKFINQLPNDTKFNVVFFSGKSINGIQKFNQKLVDSNDMNKISVTKWVEDVQSGGNGDSISAIKQAVDMNPEVIVVLSDNITSNGIYEINQNLYLDEIKKHLNKKKSNVKFTTYQYVYQDPLVLIGKNPTLMEVAKLNNGSEKNYHFITARSIGLR